MTNEIIQITPIRHHDERGSFTEIYNSKKYKELGIGIDFVQDNHSFSKKIGTIRGLHFQAPPYAQAKLVSCVSGSIFDVAVDIRAGSPNYGKWKGYKLTAEVGQQLYIPIGFAHGFITIDPNCEVIYKCSNYYFPETEMSIRWDSCEIKWPLSISPVLSSKDANAPLFSKLKTPFIFGENS